MALALGDRIAPIAFRWEFRGPPARAPQLARQALASGLFAASNRLANYYRAEIEKTPGERFFGKNTGKGASSIQAQTPRVFGNAILGTIETSRMYMLVIDQGRRPGTWPPEKPIELWVKRKLRHIITGSKTSKAGKTTANPFAKGGVQGIAEAIMVKSLVYLIRRRIKIRGFAPPYRNGLQFVAGTWRVHAVEIEALLAQAVEAYNAAWDAPAGAEA